MLKLLDILLVTKWNQTYSSTGGYIKSSVTIMLVSANHRCIQVLGCQRVIPVSISCNGGAFPDFISINGREGKRKIRLFPMLFIICRVCKIVGFFSVSSENKKWYASHHTH